MQSACVFKHMERRFAPRKPPSSRNETVPCFAQRGLKIRTGVDVIVSSGRNRVATLWLFTNGEDLFVPYCDVVAVREAHGDRRWAA